MNKKNNILIAIAVLLALVAVALAYFFGQSELFQGRLRESSSTSYDEWASGLEEEDEDPDSDEATSLEEHVLETDPNSPDRTRESETSRTDRSR